MSPAPRPVVLLLCCVALARVGALGDRKEEEAEEAHADAVSQNGRPGPLASWTVSRAGLQRDQGRLCLEEGCVAGL